MNAEELELLLKKVLAELTERQYHVLVVGFGSNQKEEHVFSLLEKHQSHCQYQFVFSEAYQEFFDSAKWEQLGRIIQTADATVLADLAQVDLILIPYLTRNSLAKLALGVADNLPLTLVNQGLLMAKPVMAANHCWLTDNEFAAFREINQNPAMQQLYYDHEAKLKTLGVQSLTLQDWKEAFEQFITKKSRIIKQMETPQVHSSTKVLTLKDVKQDPLAYLSSSQKMTDLAREFLNEHQGEGRHN